MDELPSQLSLGLRTASEYRVGLPLFVEVTLANRTAGAEYYDLLPCDPLDPPFPIEFTLVQGMDRVVLPTRSAMRGEAPRGGFDLVPGQARTFVLDLSELEVPLAQGAWQCQARWIMQHEQPRSEEAPITLAASSDDDIRLVSHLHTGGGAGQPSWAEFLQSFSAEDLAQQSLQGLSSEASQALLPYLIMHQVIHGPEPLDAFPLEVFTPHFAGVWGGEASVLHYELLTARRSHDAPSARAALLERWPGLGFRVEEIDAGQGVLAGLRARYGPQEGPR